MVRRCSSDVHGACLVSDAITSTSRGVVLQQVVALVVRLAVCSTTCCGLLRRVKWRQTASSLSRGGEDLHVAGGTQSVMCAMHLAQKHN